MDWEFDILYAIQSIRTPFLDKLMAFLSTLGNAGALWIVIGVVLCISKKYRRGGMQMLSAELLSFMPKEKNIPRHIFLFAATPFL